MKQYEPCLSILKELDSVIPPFDLYEPQDYRSETTESDLRCLLYTMSHVVTLINTCMQFYLLKPIDDVYKKYITRYRISSHCLNIEHGRYINELGHVHYATLMI